MVECAVSIMGIFTADELREIEETVNRVILQGSGWGELVLRWERGRLVAHPCTDNGRFARVDTINKTSKL